MHQWQAEHAARLLNVRSGQRILDVATCTGLAVRAAKSRAAGASFVGIDLSEQMLRVAIQQTRPVHHAFLRAASTSGGHDR